MADLLNNAGLESLAGFAYQMCVFILLLTKLGPDEQLEFETIDDIAIQRKIIDDVESDYSIKQIRNAEKGRKVFQVKKTTVTTEVSRKILYNWLLALKHESGEVSEFDLYIEENYKCKMGAFSGDCKDEYKRIMESSKDSNALVSRIKELYKDDEKAFEKDYNTIVLHHKVKKINVKHEILKSVSEALHTDASTISEVYAGKRVTELFTVFCSRIVDSALNGKAFITTRREYMQVCEEICKRISPAKYEPDYNSFNLLYSSNGLSADIMRSREYKQLKSCNLTLERITQHISWEMYYQNIRRHYLEDANDSIIKQTEDVAFQNHADVVEELKDEGIDTPVKRLIKTKEKPISTLTNEYSRWGTYIYLTGDAVNNQISWEDEDGI